MNAFVEQERGLTGIRRVAVIVAHPDDETLWAGGLLLSHPEWSPFIATLCRAGDADRAPKFARALEQFHAQGAMGDLDDGPEQEPLVATRVRDAILALLPERRYDLLVTHAPYGEYTRHRRHGEVSRALRVLWLRGQLQARQLWQFAYEDGGGSYLPRPQWDAGLRLTLSNEIWARKYQLITEVYGFGEATWEARMLPRMEAFKCFFSPA
ncbi:MAG: PIG-L family deacetylase [Verrucomicrobia bacterium]|nr:MAG: PIG-L family deacetylase [Verrucomicrobiota bacterium]